MLAPCLEPGVVAVVEALGALVALSGERSDGLAVAGEQIHVLAPAPRLEDESPCPAGRNRFEVRAELEVHLFAGAEHGQRTVGGRHKLEGGAEVGVQAGLVTCVPVR